MFSFLKRLFGKMVGKGQAPAIEPAETVTTETLPRQDMPAPRAPAPISPLAGEQAETYWAPPISVAPPPPPAPAEPMISEDFLRGSVFDDEDGEEVLPGDKANLGMVPSIGNPHAYMIGLVGEEFHREAVHDLQEGTPITLELEPGNPPAPSAIAAVDPYGRVIGYVSPDSWLREAVYGGGAGFSAMVLAVEMGDRGYCEVVLEVEPSEEPLRERRYEG